MLYFNQSGQKKPSYVWLQELNDIISFNFSIKLSNSEMKAFVSYYYLCNDITKPIYEKHKINKKCVVSDLTFEKEKTK